MIALTMVLFRPDFEELALTLRSLAEVSREFHAIYFLLSGTTEDRERLRESLGQFGLSGCSVVHHRHDNLGFASGHNVLLQRAFAQGAQHCVVVNPDIRIRPGALGELAEHISLHGTLGLYGPSLERVRDTGSPVEDRVFDSNGICWTSSARHFDADMGRPWTVIPGRVRKVAGVTGACLWVPKDIHDRIILRSGYFFDDVFLAYREDAELGVRSDFLGIGSYIVEMEGIAHVRAVRGFARGRVLPDLLGVRNRYVMLFRLGELRPGGLGGLIRDVLVLAGTYVRERTSLPGLRQAFAIRRYLSYSANFRR